MFIFIALFENAIFLSRIGAYDYVLSILDTFLYPHVYTSRIKSCICRNLAACEKGGTHSQRNLIEHIFTPCHHQKWTWGTLSFLWLLTLFFPQVAMPTVLLYWAGSHASKAGYIYWSEQQLRLLLVHFQLKSNRINCTWMCPFP